MTAKKTTAPRAQVGSGKAAAPKRKRADWEAIERDYRAGKLTLREMAAKHGCTNGRIAQVAKEKAWSRGDLKEQVQQATQALLIAKEVSTEVSRVKQGLSETVVAAAEVNKQVILAHRGRVAQATDVAMRMLAELDATTGKADQIAAMFEVLAEDMDEKAKAAAQQQLRDFMRLHTRVGSVHKLMDALGKAQTLERQAFGIGDEEGEGGKSKPAPTAYDVDDDALLAEILADRRARAAA